MAASLASHAAAQQAGRLTPRDTEFGPETPSGWVHIGYDLNNDGRFDRTEYIYIADLERAREASAGRMQQHGQALRAPIAPGQFGPGFQAGQGQPGQRLMGFSEPVTGGGDAAAPTETVQGQIVSLRAIPVPRTGQLHIAARIRTRSGETQRADLGPAKALEPLNLWIGDRVALSGRRAMLGRMPIVLADQIQASGQSVRVDRTSSPVMRQGTGRIRSLSPAQIDGLQHLLAVMDLQSGDTTLVDLGPASDLRPLSMDSGTPVTIIGRRCTINGRPAVEAHEVDSGGMAVLVDQGSPALDIDKD
jgi:hypothetical protein